MLLLPKSLDRELAVGYAQPEPPPIVVREVTSGPRSGLGRSALREKCSSQAAAPVHGNGICWRGVREEIRRVSDKKAELRVFSSFRGDELHENKSGEELRLHGGVSS